MIINLKSTSPKLNPNIPIPSLRPRCIHPGCNKPRAIISTLKDGSPNYRKWCWKHHDKRTAAKHGKNKIAEITAERAGFSDVRDFINSKHPSLRYRKEYCENIDGRLGFVCTTTIYDKCMLDVDHISGNPSNNRKNNLQTLCKCCHSYKTIKNKDYITPGRKAIRESKFVAEMC